MAVSLQTPAPVASNDLRAMQLGQAYTTGMVRQTWHDGDVAVKTDGLSQKAMKPYTASLW